MYSITVKGPDKFIKSMQRQAQYAMKLTIDDSLFQSHKAVKGSMRQHIKGGPVRFTEKGMRVKKTNMRNLYGKVYFQSDRGYIREIIEGGTKNARSKYIPEPGSDNYGVLTSKGNYRRNYLNKLFTAAGATKAEANGSIYGKQPKRRGASISIGKSKSGVQGIWEWKGKGDSRRPKLLVSLERKSRKQRVTFPAREVAAKSFDRYFRKRFSRNLKYAISTSRL